MAKKATEKQEPTVEVNIKAYETGGPTHCTLATINGVAWKYERKAQDYTVHVPLQVGQIARERWRENRNDAPCDVYGHPDMRTTLLSPIGEPIAKMALVGSSHDSRLRDHGKDAGILS